MKLNNATEDQKFLALLELDGWKWTLSPFQSGEGYQRDGQFRFIQELSSYNDHNSILSLIHKLPKDTKARIVKYFMSNKRELIDDMITLLDAKPTELCNYTLLATGKFEL